MIDLAIQSGVTYIDTAYPNKDVSTFNFSNFLVSIYIPPYP